MSTGNVVGLVFGIIAALGLGGLALGLSIKGLLSSQDPDITTSTGQRVGRSGLVFFLVLGIVFVIVGIALIVALAKGGK